jgi:hypothetical protein
VVVAFCPCAPVLLPELAQGAAGELDDVRAACDEVVAKLAAAAREADRPVTVVAPGRSTAVADGGAGWSFRGFGFPVVGRPGEPELGPASAVGAWLLDRAGWSGERQYVEVAAGTEALPRDAWLGVHRGPALLVLGDAAAAHSARAPLSYDAGAQPYDDDVAAALAAGDPARLAALDPDEGRRLGAAGATVWRVVGQSLAGRYDGELLARSTVYGVGYLVARWT